MAQRTQAPPTMGAGGYDGGTPEIAREGGGWLVFAAVMFIAAAMLNTVYGIAALVNDDYFAADELLFGDLSMWGVFYLCLAALQIVTALLIAGRRAAGAVIGITLTLIHATVVMLSIGAYPIWSLTLLVIDGLILYGLSVYGFRRA